MERVNKVPRKPVVPPRMDLVGTPRLQAPFLLSPNAKKKYKIDIPELTPVIVKTDLFTPLDSPPSSPVHYSANNMSSSSLATMKPSSPFNVNYPITQAIFDQDFENESVTTPLAQLLPPVPTECPPIPPRGRPRGLPFLRPHPDTSASTASDSESEYETEYENEEPVKLFCPPVTALANITVTCAACGDVNMSRLGALEVQCGHFAHKSCMKTVQREGLPSMCVLCEQDCVYLGDDDSFADSGSDVPVNEAEVDVDGLEDDLLGADYDVSSPLTVTRYVRTVQPMIHEMLISVRAPNDLAIRDKKYTLTSEDIKIAHTGAMDAQGTVQFSGINARLSKMGKMRLRSTFTCDKMSVTAYLFDHVVVLTTLDDGFDNLYDFITLSDDDLLIYPMSNALVFRQPSKQLVHRLVGPRSLIGTWIAAVHDSSLNFPLAKPKTRQLAPAIEPIYIDIGCLDLCICLPFEHISVLPQILDKMGPQDRLAVVITTSDHKTAYLGPHKTGWSGWQNLATMDLDICENFVESNRNALNTAQDIYPETRYGAQKSIIFVAGCSFDHDAEHRWGIPIHTIGCGVLNIEVFRQISKRTGGQYLFAERESDLAKCIAGIAEAERTYRYHDVALYVEPVPGLTINLVVGDETVRLNETDQIEIPLGSIVSGQPKTVLIELTGRLNESVNPLSVCQLYTRHAINEQRKVADITGPLSEWTQDSLCFHKFLQMIIDAMDMGRDYLEAGDHDRCCDLLRSISKGITQYTTEFNSASDSEVLEKCRMLSKGIFELADRMDKNKCLPRASRAILNEARDVLRCQRAVTDRTLLERLFLTISN